MDVVLLVAPVRGAVVIALVAWWLERAFGRPGLALGILGAVSIVGAGVGYAGGALWRAAVLLMVGVGNLYIARWVWGSSRGRWCVIEIKRDAVDRATLGQVLDYASCLSQMSEEQLRACLQPHLEKRNIDLDEELQKRDATDSLDPDDRKVVMFVVGNEGWARARSDNSVPLRFRHSDRRRGSVQSTRFATVLGNPLPNPPLQPTDSVGGWAPA